MVDSSGKKPSARFARAQCLVRISPQLTEHLANNTLPKGDAFAVARIAGIQAAKQTSQLLPLCHPLPIDAIQVDCKLNQDQQLVQIETSAAATAKTGMEMEALTAAATAALALYDMCKSLDKSISIDNLQLIEKSGGKSGHWQRNP